MKDLKQGFFNGLNSAFEFVIGIIFWPTMALLLCKLYTEAALNHQQRQLVQTLQAQNRSQNVKFTMYTQFCTSAALAIVAYLMSLNFLLVIALIFMVVSFTEVLLRKACDNLVDLSEY
jgi:Flp pilus assembly protein TadB